MGASPHRSSGTPKTATQDRRDPGAPKLALLPRAVVEQVANLVFWSVHPRGGHFSPAEQPSLYIDDLRVFFGSLR